MKADNIAFEEYHRGQRRFFIVGIPGNYCVKAGGNNRILARDFSTLDQAREWLTTYYPSVELFDIEAL